MKLDKISILNFRSIDKMEITLEPRCQIFVGINESGKSNILKAISLLSPDVKPSVNDSRFLGADENQEQKSHVDFIFTLSSEDMEFVFKEFEKKMYFQNSIPLLQLEGSKPVLIQNYFSSQKSGLFRCDLNECKKSALYYRLPDSKMVKTTNILKKKQGINIPQIMSNSQGKIEVGKFSLFDADCILEKDLQYFDACTMEDVYSCFELCVIDFINENIPNIVYWVYDERHLLPEKVSLKTFKENPETCIPLKSMFNLAGHTDITKAIANAQERRPAALMNLLNNVSKKSTDYLHKVWRDYKSVKFSLQPNGENIDINISDAEQYYSCDQRSDGFKRFITFLLVLSARVKNAEIVDSIIIMDEPDIGLHILGQKNLSDELTKISKTNYVFYSTHSIFMIDKDNPQKHYIVTKENGISSKAQVSDSNYTDDEVIMNALGYSVFNVLKSHNLIFEGWSDKRVFDLALATKKGKDNCSIKEIGRIFTHGVREIEHITKILELANRKYVIISDSDRASLDEKNKYIKKGNEGIWVSYGDFIEEHKTLEDFIKHNSFKASIGKVRENYSALGDFDFSEFSQHRSNRGAFIQAWIKRFINSEKDEKDIFREIKTSLYTNLRPQDIEDSYFCMMSKMKELGYI